MQPGRGSNPLTELRRGTVAYCVLALLRERELYGFELVRTLDQLGGLITSKGTIYPLLSRLRGEGLVDTTWRESTVGPPRRYYRLSEQGERALDAFAHEWAQFRDAVDHLLQRGRQS
jgi:PadR family transcriptional regulator, regulatory protein PadR